MLKSLFLISLQAVAVTVYAQQKNVLMIMLDDLRPELGCYDHAIVKSPNIDKLAAQGTQFDRAYCQHALCAPSRASILTSTRPEKTGIQDLEDRVSVILPNAPTIPKVFKANGYETVGYGKIYHTGGDDASSFTKRVANLGSFKDYLLPENIAFRDANNVKLGPATEAPVAGDYEHLDGRMTLQVLEELKRIQNKKFFLTVGFMRPHLPFTAPKKYWDMYDRNQIKVPARLKPSNLYAKTFHDWSELRAYTGIAETGFLSDESTRQLIHGYYASVSYVDFLIGQIMNQLDVLGLRENTIVLLVSDHGWKLGDYGDWCKHSPMEIDNRVPLIISAPGLPVNKRSVSPVELIDIFPTLTDLCNIPTPTGLEGASLKPILNFPSAEVRSVAVNSYPRWGNELSMSVRSAKYRYTEWRNLTNNTLVSRELFDYESGFILGNNIAANPIHKEMMKDFGSLLTNVSAKTKTQKVVNGFDYNKLYKIKGLGDEQMVIGADPLAVNRNPATLARYNDDLDQLWRIKEVNGWYEIISATTGKVLSIPSANSVDGASLVVQDRQNTNNEKWRFQEVNDQSLIIRNKANETKVANISNQLPIATSPSVSTLGINETIRPNSTKFFIYEVPRTTQTIIASIDDSEYNDMLLIYPNPSIDGIFNLSQSGNWKVTSLTGKELKSGHGNQINLSEQPKGVYLIKLNEKIERVVVE